MDKSIKIQRTESVLRELIPEALSTLEDEMLRGVCVVDVECSRGKYDAIVYLDGNVYDAKEKSYILSFRACETSYSNPLYANGRVVSLP